MRGKIHNNRSGDLFFPQQQNTKSLRGKPQTFDLVVTSVADFIATGTKPFGLGI